MDCDSVSVHSLIFAVSDLEDQYRDFSHPFPVAIESLTDPTDL